LSSFQIFEEVKLITGADICAAVRRQVPKLLEKFSSTPAFINGKSDCRVKQTRET
jgi:hypothetical protein